MSVPEVEALVSQKYEIKRRLGKGVSASGALGSLGRCAAGSCVAARARPPRPVPRPVAALASVSLPAPVRAADRNRAWCWMPQSVPVGKKKGFVMFIKP